MHRGKSVKKIEINIKLGKIKCFLSSEDITKIIEMFKSGLSTYEIADKFKDCNAKRINKILVESGVKLGKAYHYINH